MSPPPTKLCAVCGIEFSKPVSDSRATWEKRKCCTYKCSVEIRRGRPNPKASAALRGRKQSPEAIAARSDGLKRAHAEGRMHVIDTAGLRREQTSQWKGDDITYRSAHTRLYRERGKPTECEFCGRTDVRLQWALRRDASVLKTQADGTGAGLRFSPRPEDYVAACSPCHQEYDERERDPSTGRYI